MRDMTIPAVDLVGSNIIVDRKFDVHLMKGTTRALQNHTIQYQSAILI